MENEQNKPDILEFIYQELLKGHLTQHQVNARVINAIKREEILLHRKISDSLTRKTIYGYLNKLVKKYHIAYSSRDKLTKYSTEKFIETSFINPDRNNLKIEDWDLTYWDKRRRYIYYALPFVHDSSKYLSRVFSCDYIEKNQPIFDVILKNLSLIEITSIASLHHIIRKKVIMHDNKISQKKRTNKEINKFIDNALTDINTFEPHPEFHITINYPKLSDAEVEYHSKEINHLLNEVDRLMYLPLRFRLFYRSKDKSIPKDDILNKYFLPAVTNLIVCYFNSKGYINTNFNVSMNLKCLFNRT